MYQASIIVELFASVTYVQCTFIVLYGMSMYLRCTLLYFHCTPIVINWCVNIPLCYSNLHPCYSRTALVCAIAAQTYCHQGGASNDGRFFGGGNVVSMKNCRETPFSAMLKQ